MSSGCTALHCSAVRLHPKGDKIGWPSASRVWSNWMWESLEVRAGREWMLLIQGRRTIYCARHCDAVVTTCHHPSEKFSTMYSTGLFKDSNRIYPALLALI